MSDDDTKVLKRMISTMEGLARRICALEAELKAVRETLGIGRSLDALARRLDELEAANAEAEARPAAPPLRLASP